jgi:hypothetical protein
LFYIKILLPVCIDILACTKQEVDAFEVIEHDIIVATLLHKLREGVLKVLKS